MIQYSHSNGGGFINGNKKILSKIRRRGTEKIEHYLCLKKNSHESEVWGKILLALGENTHEKVSSKPKVAKKEKLIRFQR